MASGFIIFKDGRCFARRWTEYDEIIRIAVQELDEIGNGQELANWLKTLIPETDNNGDNELGWGFIDPRTGEIVNRELDLRSLTLENQQLFWIAIQKGRAELFKNIENHSTLSTDFFETFYKMFELSEKGEPPMELTDWNKLADPCTEKNGPGWDMNNINES